MNNESTQNNVPPLFKEILCPIDFNVVSLDALRLGKRLAERNRARLSVIHVMTPHVPGGVVLQNDKALAQAKLETIMREELYGVDHQVIVRGGNPVREIVAAEAELGVDLCVMPGQGHMGTSHLFRRSITERVARESSCPVLTVSANGLVA